MQIDRLDHLVLTVADISATCEFYSRVMGFRPVEIDGRWALHFGRQKINLHQRGNEFEPKAAHPVCGSADFCCIADETVAETIAHLQACGIEIVEGPVERNGALGLMTSVYFRDPDGNLIEVSKYID